MYTFGLRLAEKNIRATVNFQSTVDFCRGYLADFETADVSVCVELSDLSRELESSRCESKNEGAGRTEFSAAYLETLALYRRIVEALIDFDIILFHGSAISLDGECYLFTAKSGTGKSTHARLWRELFGSRAVMVNDDKPLISVKDGEVRVFGTPWNGKHRLGSNISAPLRAICILDRAEQNSIIECTPMSEYPKILTQTYRKNSPEFMKKTLELLDTLLHTVRVFRLGCNMNIEAAEVAYNGMKG